MSSSSVKFPFRRAALAGFFLASGALAVWVAEPLFAQEPRGGDQSKQGATDQKGPEGRGARGGRGGGGGRGQAQPDDNTGFTPIFDGKTLDGWDGDPRFWRVEDGNLVGQTTESNRLEQNTFLIWRGGQTADFELKLEVKISDTGNSGIQYRSAPRPEAGQWGMRGYQADIDGAMNFTGMLYEEGGSRGFLAPRGSFNRMLPERNHRAIGNVGDNAALKEFIKAGDFNQLHIIARGNTLIHVVNGRVMSIFIDEDAANRLFDGLLGLQLHVGPPMKVEYRNVLIKKL